MCNAHLVDIDEVQSNDQRIKAGYPATACKFIVSCYKCKGKSLKTRLVEGTVVIMTPNDVSYDIDYEEDTEDGDVTVHTIKTERRK